VKPSIPDSFWLKLVDEQRSLSEDRSTKTGAIIAAADGFVLSAGCNSLPLGVQDSDARRIRPAKYDWTEHAERNAIYHAAKHGIPLRGSTMYMRWFPCVDCARAVIQSGIIKLVCEKYEGKDDPRWAFAAAKTMLEEAGVSIRFFASDA